MSTRTSASSVFGEQAAAAAVGGAKTKKVWNRQKQQWVEVPVDEQEEARKTEQAKASSPLGSAQSSNAFANGANQNAGNVMTGRSSTRVRAPPGGKSSISFGAEEGSNIAVKAAAVAAAAAAMPPKPAVPLAASSVAPQVPKAVASNGVSSVRAGLLLANSCLPL
jgi:hypothetical protein